MKDVMSRLVAELLAASELATLVCDCGWHYLISHIRLQPDDNAFPLCKSIKWESKPSECAGNW